MPVEVQDSARASSIRGHGHQGPSNPNPSQPTRQNEGRPTPAGFNKERREQDKATTWPTLHQEHGRIPLHGILPSCTYAFAFPSTDTPLSQTPPFEYHRTSRDPISSQAADPSGRQQVTRATPPSPTTPRGAASTCM
ncbi:uncharacterized protein MAM_05734 [Metarhizium album ARSEF 1941]|uniref:Uncharacterized protein n=1 Tax=Metarhizium album (strain ARSEF 1941) TaxID=1081103 RepID=A0A0B2WU50_METAS|nr:uncharacterized protein MAM_05734 [Metarhizium album ARSEF 1941]KHN96445.1 hypothetical protein MAM_05734 [Metarhizium album ARSEF 1941]